METSYKIEEVLIDSEFKRIAIVNCNGKRYIQKQFFQHDNKRVYQILCRNDNPYFPKVYKVQDIDQGFEVIEAFIVGRVLYDLLPMDNEDTIVEYALQIVDALSWLHEKGIVHRDLKPENIMVIDHHIKIIDFDIAKKVVKDTRRDTHVLGSVGYAAPEQYGFSSSDDKTDIFAFGNVLNEMKCGYVASEHLCEGKLRSVVLRCTKIDPDRRYGDIKTLKRELLRIKQHKSRYRLPGFRSNQIGHKIIASIGYLFIVVFSLTVITGDGEDMLSNINVKIFSFYFFGTIIVVATNYLDIQQYNPFPKHRKVGSFLMWFTIFVLGILIIQYIFSFIS